MPTLNRTIQKTLATITSDDLRDWAGDTILKRGEGYVGQVEKVFITPDGALAAWVMGTSRYATSVRIDKDGEFDDFCTCPYDYGPCKHAVALLLAGADLVRRKKKIPALRKDDYLYLELSGVKVDDGEDDDNDEDSAYPVGPALIRKTDTRKPSARADIAKLLADKDAEALRNLLIDIADHDPKARRRIREQEHLATGKADKIVAVVRKDIARITAEPVWDNPWQGIGNLPDYSPIAERLRALLTGGHADAVVSLGEDLWRRGNAQVEQSDDEGETAQAIAACLEIVLDALPRSSRSPPQQLLWVIDRLLEDQYSLLEVGAGNLLKNRAYTQAQWRDVADALEQRLQAMAKPRGKDFMQRWPRERLLLALLDAYARAGWKERVIPLLEAEADYCMCHARLVDELIAARDLERARQWCIRGYRATEKEAPGIAHVLRDRLRELALRERRHDLVAAYRAEEFFNHPGPDSFREIQKTSEKVKCWPTVRTAILRYLESGDPGRPKDWPLPAIEVEPSAGKRKFRTAFPDYDSLIRIAVLERRFDDVVSIYQALHKSKRRIGPDLSEAVAAAVSKTHPDATLDIWRTLAENQISQVKPKAYLAASRYLRMMRDLYARQRRLSEWRQLLDDLRARHKAKRRLMEIIDRLPDGSRGRSG